MSILKVKKLREDVVMPKYESDLASGMDVRAYACEMWDNDLKTLIPVQLDTYKENTGWWIPANTTIILKTGLAVACGTEEEVQVRPRSGYSLKSPMRLSNSIGTIDADYRGEVGIIMTNNGQYGKWFIPYSERVAQLVICPVIRSTLIEVDELDDTERGAGAYGSTGTK